MKIHEYQAKEILRHYGVATPRGIPCFNVDESVNAARQLGGNVWVVKAQIYAGGRGKGGGVKVAHSLEEVRDLAESMLGMRLVTHQTGPEGQTVHRLFIEEGVNIANEYYVGMVVDRGSQRVCLMASSEGGMDIETVAEETPHLVHKEYVDPTLGLQPFQARKIAFNLGLSGKAFKEMVRFVMALYKAFVGSDASLFEINPCMKSGEDRIIAVDCKVTLDDNALYRHPALAEMRDTAEEDPTEVEATELGLNFINLDGNVGCMVNGAGLAMATMDMIKLSGGEPANFLDVGGTADAKRVEQAFHIILKDPKVKAILINIFGGIVRCDRVAQGVVDAYQNIGNIKVPIIVRLQGTNADLAKEIIDNSGLAVQSAIILKDAAELVKKALG